MYDYLIVGSGLYGSICAYELNKKGFSTNPKLIRNMDDLVDSIVKEMKL